MSCHIISYQYFPVIYRYRYTAILSYTISPYYTTSYHTMSFHVVNPGWRSETMKLPVIRVIQSQTCTWIKLTKSGLLKSFVKSWGFEIETPWTSNILKSIHNDNQASIICVQSDSRKHILTFISHWISSSNHVFQHLKA